jgi:hypothetical protein
MSPRFQAWVFRVFGREQIIAPTACVHYCGFRYGEARFNPYQNYIEGLARGEEPKLVRNQFVEFLRYYRPEHFGEALGVKLSRKYPLWLFPWSRRSGSGGWCTTPDECPDVLTHFSHGAISRKRIEMEFRWLENAFNSIKVHGFCPERFKSIILTRKLVRTDGDSIYLVLDGNHRVSALIALGIIEVPVRFLRIATVHESDVESWPFVRNGTYSKDDALAVFRVYFDGNSSGRTTDQPALVLPPFDNL